MVGATVEVISPAKATRPIATSSGALSRKVSMADVAARNLPRPCMLLLASSTITVERSMSPVSTILALASTAPPLSSTRTSSGRTVDPAGSPSVDTRRLTVPRSDSTWSMLISSAAEAGVTPERARTPTARTRPLQRRSALTAYRRR
jgi:hypothetical protein